MRDLRDRDTSALIDELDALRLYAGAADPDATDEDGPLRAAIAEVKRELLRRVELAVAV